MNLDEVYKTKLPESHEAGLQAVYDLALAHAAQAFVAPAAELAPVIEQPPVA